MGMALPAGGHLTHGWNVSITGTLLPRACSTACAGTPSAIDFDEVRELARKERPKLLFAGGTAIPRTIDFAAFAEIAQRGRRGVRGRHRAHRRPRRRRARTRRRSPVADVVSTTTHKTLRGPRGGMLMCTAAHQKAIDRAVFPGLQGGPHNHTTAGDRGRAQGGGDRRVQALRAPDRRERARARGGARRARLRARHRRHRQPPDPRRPHDQERVRQDRREGARRRRHRAQLQLACRSTRASRSIRRASGSARASVDEPRHGASPRCEQIAAWMDARGQRAGRRRAARADRRRDPRAVREVPGARHPGVIATRR